MSAKSKRPELPEPSRASTYPPLPDGPPGPQGAPDAARQDADASITAAASTGAAALMGSTYTSQVGGPLYRDLQEAAVQVGTAPAHADAEEVAADATWAWTRSDELGEVIREVIAKADLPSFPSDRGVRRLARAVAVLLLRGATAEAVASAVSEAVAAVSLDDKAPLVVVREVGVAIQELGKRAAPLQPGAVEVEIPFPPEPGTDFAAEGEAIAAVIQASKPAAVSADVRYVATESAVLREDADLYADPCAELYAADDARWYFSGRAPRWGQGSVVGSGAALADPRRDFRFAPAGAVVHVQVPGWAREARRHVVRATSPLEFFGETTGLRYSTSPTGLSGYGAVVGGRWLSDPLADFSLLVPGETVQVAGGVWPADVLGGPWGGDLGWARGPCSLVSLCLCALVLDVPLPPGAQVSYVVEADRRGRSQVRPLHLSLTAP